MVRLAGVEGGGSTFVLAISEGRVANIVVRVEIPTTSPDETIASCVDFLRSHKYDALGIACFGPIDLHPSSPTYGYITTTPKKGWREVDILGPLRAVRPAVPVMFDTDVNAPAFCEYRALLAEARACDMAVLPSSCAYITVGTGVGVGLVINGLPLHGLLHPEGGHVAVPRLPEDLVFDGSNPSDCFGGTCAENMCCSIALAERAGLANPSDLSRLPDDHPVWKAAAHYLGALCANIVLMASPERIVLSGGVMQRHCLFAMVREATRAHLNGYIKVPQLNGPGIDMYIMPSRWGNDAGLVGALTLAQSAFDSSPRISRLKRVFGMTAVAAAGAAVALALMRKR
eukprot:TRINITY_DN45659_c0_g1_i1.p1 TRINITY_DN45659_c0_g1~~TRINITY_DN45659_c0_g1_i1.p1  ORF type:complete len:359 (-),score=51.08 TRINITY_DN45659_c0_g1_i1:180-1208(-)